MSEQIVCEKFGWSHEQYVSWRKSTKRALNREMYEMLRTAGWSHLECVRYMRSLHAMIKQKFGS